MNNSLIVTISLLTVLFIIVMASIIITNNKKKKKYKEKIDELEYEKNKLIGVPILSELSKVRELVKTDDLKVKLNIWDNEFKEIKEVKINYLTDLITETDFLIDKKDYSGAMKRIANIEIVLEEVRNKTEELLEEIKVITNSEERNRAIITKLKVVYRDLENKFETTETDYDFVSKEIKKELTKIKKKFNDFECKMDNNDYIEVEKIVLSLDESINLLKRFLEEVPSLILMGKMIIPNKIEEIKTHYSRMQRDGYSLDYLNIEYNLEEIEKNVKTIIDNLKEFKFENAEIELKTIMEYFDNIYKTFDKEKEDKDIFHENIKKLKKRMETVNKIVYDIYVQMDDIKNTYDLSESEINKFSQINSRLEKINEDYKNLYDHGNRHTFAYSKLVEELEGLNNRLVRLQDDLDYRLKSITSMKDDESRAKEQLDMIESLLLKSKNKLKDYKIPVIPNSYFIELKEASEAIKEIIKELDKKPITIKVLNIRVDTARDLVFKIYNKTNDIVKNVMMCEKIIMYGNRYRSISEVIDKKLDEATVLFNKGLYKQAIEISIKAISQIDDNFIYELGMEEESN